MEKGQSMQERALVFWKCSLAWKGDPIFAAGETYQTMIEKLHPLYTSLTGDGLAKQADQLANLMVRNKKRRPKTAGKVTAVDFTTKTVTKISGPKAKAAQAA